MARSTLAGEGVTNFPDASCQTDAYRNDRLWVGYRAHPTSVAMITTLGLSCARVPLKAQPLIMC